MKRFPSKVFQKMFLLISLILMASGNTEPVKAEVKNYKTPNKIFVGLMTPDVPKTVCIGKKMTLEYYFVWLFAPPLIPSLDAVVIISAEKGRVDPIKTQFLSIRANSTYTGKFSYKAQKEGKENIKIKVSMGGYDITYNLSFQVKKCEATIQFNKTQTSAYDIYSMDVTYSGSGTIKADDDGKISGSGGQEISSVIPAFSSEGATCTQTPWEGSSGISFSGQVSDDENDVSMEVEALAVSSSVITCTDDEGYSGSMTFPSYTYSSCKVQLADFSFDGGTLDVPFNCPGQDPYDVPITIIPRRQS